MTGRDTFPSSPAARAIGANSGTLNIAAMPARVRLRSIIFRLPGNPTERRGRRASSYRVDRAIGGDQSLLARASFQRIAMFHTDDAVIAALAEPWDDRLIVDLARQIGRESCRARVCQYV